MIRYILVCVLLGSLSWGQATASKASSAAFEAVPAASVTPEPTVREKGEQTKVPNITPDTPVIAIDGLCENRSAGNTTASECKTVITQAQFERVIEAVQPNMRTRARREFALQFANALVMTKKAEQMGLDKGANYEEQMKLARIQVLSRELNKVIQEKASDISDNDIDEYYRKNTSRFEKAEMDRIYVPKTRQAIAPFGRELSGADRLEHSQESEQTMKEEANKLRACAVAGEEFTKLQARAYEVAGIKSPGSNTSIAIRRVSLPASQASVMDLNPGEVSAVLADPNGYVIYKVKTKETLPLDQAREEIKATLRSLRMQDEMRGIQGFATTSLDETYFSPEPRPQVGIRAGESAKSASKPHSSKPE